MEIPTHEQLLDHVEAFLSRHAMAESRLGREATGEPGLVSRIREKRNLTLDTLNKLAAFMADQDETATSAATSTSPGKSGELTDSPAVCSFCERPAADPATANCIDPDCALRPREVA